jgi:hypothetical protein
MLSPVFPNGRVLLRASVRSNDAVRNAGWLALVVAIVTAAAAATGATTGSPLVRVGKRLVPLGPSWARVFAIGAIASVGILVAQLLGPFLWSLLTYRWSNHVDNNWQARASMRDDQAIFQLVTLDPRHEVTELGWMEAVIRGPDGPPKTKPDDDIAIGSGLRARPKSGVVTRLYDAAPGRYEIRWYGARGRWYYEVTRGIFDLSADGHAAENQLEAKRRNTAQPPG